MFMDDDDGGQDFTTDIELTKVRDVDLISIECHRYRSYKQMIIFY